MRLPQGPASVSLTDRMCMVSQGPRTAGKAAQIVTLKMWFVPCLKGQRTNRARRAAYPEKKVSATLRHGLARLRGATAFFLAHSLPRLMPVPPPCLRGKGRF